MSNVTDENRFPTPPEGEGNSVPVTPATNTSEDGREAGLWQGGRYGMNNGRHVGRSVLDETVALEKQFKFRPAALGRLQAATRRALGR